jgi:cysteine desulfurase
MIFDLDANATYAPSESLQALVQRAWIRLGNPSSLHRGGQRAKAAVEEARESVRALIGAGPKDQVVFTSGATEANNTVIASATRAATHVVSSTIEHPCVLGPLRVASENGTEVALVSPTTHGEVTVDSVAAALRYHTQLVSIMAANNETGVVNDVKAITRVVRANAPKALVHTDAAQVFGKLAITFAQLAVDCLTLSGHKLGALTGVGALVIREGVHLTPLIRGGPQEAKLRGGTENVLGIISLGVAASAILQEGAERGRAMQAVRDTFERELLRSISKCEVNGASVARLPNTSNVFISGVRADDLLVALDLEGIYVSSGAACSSGKPEPSHVLSAMGQPEERVRSSLRFSFRADQSPELGATVAEKVAQNVERIRAQLQ